MELFSDDKCSNSVIIRQAVDQIKYSQVQSMTDKQGMIFYKTRSDDCDSIVLHRNILQFGSENFKVAYRCDNAESTVVECLRNARQLE